MIQIVQFALQKWIKLLKVLKDVKHAINISILNVFLHGKNRIQHVHFVEEV
jgi:hypothetical protein